MASGDNASPSTAKANIGKIKEGIGKGPKMGAGGAVDPTSKSPKSSSGIADFMSDSELKPNSVSGTRSF